MHGSSLQGTLDRIVEGAPALRKKLLDLEPKRLPLALVCVELDGCLDASVEGHQPDPIPAFTFVKARSVQEGVQRLLGEGHPALPSHRIRFVDDEHDVGRLAQVVPRLLNGRHYLPARGRQNFSWLARIHEPAPSDGFGTARSPSEPVRSRYPGVEVVVQPATA